MVPDGGLPGNAGGEGFGCLGTFLFVVGVILLIVLLTVLGVS